VTTIASPYGLVSDPTHVRTRVQIDLNVRVRGNQTFASLADVDGALGVGEPVKVYEAESELVGAGHVTEIDPDKGLVYLSVDWRSLRPGATPPSAHLELSTFMNQPGTAWQNFARLATLIAFAYQGVTDRLDPTAQHWQQVA
jgi:hypothetical protein